MKQLCLVAACLLAACSSTEPTTLNSTADHKAKASPANATHLVKTAAVADQQPAFPLVMGGWVVHTVQRQAGGAEETINLNMELLPDYSFVLATACGDIRGSYALTGEGEIRFINTAATAATCANREPMLDLLRLLTTQVSHYTANGNMLFLKDNAGNNVFRVVR